MGAIVSCCCSCCCDKTSHKNNANYLPAGVNDSSSKSYDNTIHVSEIYGNNSTVELAPSDNPTTSTYFRSILQQPKESPQQSSVPLSTQTKVNQIGFAPSLSPKSNGQETDNRLQYNPNPHPTTTILPKPLTATIQPNNLYRSNESKTRLIKHSNSCSTIYVDDSTVSQPNWKATIKCVSIAIHSHLVHRKSNKTMDIFDEKLHPLTKDPVPDDYDKTIPEQKNIYRFMRILFTAAQLTAECAIVTLVYLERVLSYGSLDLCPSNWKRLVLGAIMLASKVWDDQAVWNVDFCQILKDITVNEMNELEREYVQLLQFNVNVASSIYAKYYFDLRQIANENQISFPDELLTKEKAIKLEALSLVNNRLQQVLPSSALASKPSNAPPSSSSHHHQQTNLAPITSLRRSASMEFSLSQRKSLLIIS